MPVPVVLCDRSLDLVKAWRIYFSDETKVRVLNQNILTLDVDAIAIPANSFGYTDGGVDVAISRDLFDWNMQQQLHEVIRRRYHGELPVGRAHILPTGSNHFRYVIVAPTMRVPTDVSDSVNAYLAMRAILLAIEEFNHASGGTATDWIRSVAITGLCTGTGKMPPERAAFQMRAAYDSVALVAPEWAKNMHTQAAHDQRMREI